MTFNVSLGFSGLKNEKAKEEVDKVYALFVGETVIANEVCGHFQTRFMVATGLVCCLM